MLIFTDAIGLIMCGTIVLVSFVMWRSVRGGR